MRIAISALVGMTLAALATSASAQPPPAAPGNGVAPTPLSDAPPPPPPPGAATEPPPPPPLAPMFPRESLVPGEDLRAPLELAGWRDGFFIRDSKDYFRLFPRALLESDVYSFFGSGVGDVPSSEGGTGLNTRMFIRRARLDLGGEFLRRWTFRIVGELGDQSLNNDSGRQQVYASTAGQTPTADTVRYAPVQSVASTAGLGDAWLNFNAAPFLNIMVGQFTVPFSMENRTTDEYTPWMERNLPIRSFVVPSRKDLGASVWGDFDHGVLSYEIGVFGGDGQNRPSVDSRADFIGRLYTRPFAQRGTSALAKSAQLGVSARHGDRDPKAVGYDYAPITTGQGFVLWSPTYRDSLGRRVHVIPSAAQNEIGGELRLRTTMFSLQGEAYYVNNDTREAVDGYQLTNTERLGRVQGVGWYAQLSIWPLGDTFIAPDPGTVRLRTLDLASKGHDRPHRGLEILAIVGGVNATYQGASRGGLADPKATASNITVYQYGFGATYWYTKHIRLMANYIVYHTPGSGSSDNAAVVPANLTKSDAGTPNQGHILHELGGRAAIAF